MAFFISFSAHLSPIPTPIIPRFKIKPDEKLIAFKIHAGESKSFYVNEK